MGTGNLCFNPGSGQARHNGTSAWRGSGALGLRARQRFRVRRWVDWNGGQGRLRRRRLCAVLGRSSDCAHTMAAAVEALTKLFDENFEAIGEVWP